MPFVQFVVYVGSQPSLQTAAASASQAESDLRQHTAISSGRCAAMRSNNEDRLLTTSRLSRKKLPFVRRVSDVSDAYGSIALLISLGLDMTLFLAKKSSPIANQTQSATSFTAHLTSEQLQALGRCARGISLRFDALEIVYALVAGGYAQKGVAGVITMTAEGHEYLRLHAG